MAGLGRGSNPCSVLNSYHQGCRYELRAEWGPPHAKEFTMAVALPGLEREYVGLGKSKKQAKQAAASKALLDLYDLRLQLGGPDSGESARVGHVPINAQYRVPIHGRFTHAS